MLGQLYYVHTLSSDYFKTDTATANDYLVKDRRCIIARRYFSDIGDKETNHPFFDKLQYKVMFICPEGFSGKSLSEIKADTTTFNFPEMKFTPSIKWAKR